MIVYPFFGLWGTTYEKGILQPIMTRRVLLGIILYLFGPQGQNLCETPFWILLSHFRFSKHEMTNEFAFIGLIKLNDERPNLGMNPSFLRFVKI